MCRPYICTSESDENSYLHSLSLLHLFQQVLIKRLAQQTSVAIPVDSIRAILRAVFSIHKTHSDSHKV